MKTSNLLLDLGSHGHSSIKDLFDFYHNSEKVTPTGLKYHTYAGYYHYLITGSRDGGLLKPLSREDLLQWRKYTWVNVVNLDNHLYENLVANLASKALVWQLQVNAFEVVWTEPDRDLSAAERRWLSVVQRWCANQP